MADQSWRPDPLRAPGYKPPVRRPPAALAMQLVGDIKGDAKILMGKIDLKAGERSPLRTLFGQEVVK